MSAVLQPAVVCPPSSARFGFFQLFACKRLGRSA